MKRFLIILIIGITYTSCYEKNTNNAFEAYRYWAGTKPPNDLELFEGKYWESAHWTKEYILFLKFKSTEFWWNEFVKQNLMSEDKNDWTFPNNTPEWFQPSKNSIKYSPINDFYKSKCFRDNQTGLCYILITWVRSII